jgi:membrane protease YdiL (CAAX protease family)
MPLAKSFLHPEELSGIDIKWGCTPRQQEDTLAGKGEKQQCSQKLRPTKAIFGEKIPHWVSRVFYHFRSKMENEPIKPAVIRSGLGLRESGPRPDAELFSAASHPLHSLFLEPQGLRAGWRFALYLLMSLAIALLLIWPTTHWQPKGAGKLWRDWLVEWELLAGFLIAAFVMARVEKRPFGDYGLPGRQAFGRNFWAGAIWGIVWLTALMLTLRLLGAFSFGGLAVHGMRMLKFAAFYALVFLTVGFFEEFAFRGYTQFTLSGSMGFWPAAGMLSLVFGALHLGNPGEAWVGALSAGLIGLFFCLTLRRTGSLWFAVGMHASFDWGESYLYSVPDSGGMAAGHLLNSSFHGSRWLTGGSVGPEGSVLIFVMIALMWLAFDRMYPRPICRPATA